MAPSKTIKDANSTAENLSAIRNRNLHRRLLVLDNEYSENSLSSSSIHDFTADDAQKEGTQSEGVQLKTKRTHSREIDQSETIDQSIEKSIELDPSLPSLAPVVSTCNKQFSFEEIDQTVSEINGAFPKRVNKRRSDDNDSQYVLRFRDAGPVGQPDSEVPLYTIFDAPKFKTSSGFGIYVLFWLGIAFLTLSHTVDYFFKNEQHISIFNWPIVKIFRKDLIAVALTDGAMYLASYGAFAIQYLITAKVFEWRRTGMVVQSVYTAAYFMFWLWFAGEHVMNFPWIARVFLVLHSLVFVMKMHSYAFYNGYLWRVYRELQYSKTIMARLADSDLAALENKDEVMATLEKLVEFCLFEFDYQVNVQHTRGMRQNRFPGNINLFNYFEYLMMPTCVYQLNFPRTKKIRVSFVFEKVMGIFGIIFVMITVAQKWLYPLVMLGIEARRLPLTERAIEYVFILLDIMPPFLMMYLLTFFLIWDMILNAIAELSYYADRDFYGPWWSCTDWYEFSRIWNVPVHKFLLRHVYHLSISAFNMSKLMAGLVTFMLSLVVHELVMYIIFGKVRGYLLLLQMSQLPLIAMSRTRFMRDKKVLGNVICWFGFILGPSIILALYVVW